MFRTSVCTCSFGIPPAGTTGRELTLDTSKIQSELGMEFRDMDTSVVETANDLVAWEHVERRD